VKLGDRITIADRKREVAIIVPKDNGADEEEILSLMQTGLANWSGGKPQGISDRIPSIGRLVSDVVLQNRR
jgi:hypothetical protein